MDIHGQPIRDPVTGETDLAFATALAEETAATKPRPPPLQDQARWLEQANQLEKTTFHMKNRAKFVKETLAKYEHAWEGEINVRKLEENMQSLLRAKTEADAADDWDLAKR